MSILFIALSALQVALCRADSSRVITLTDGTQIRGVSNNHVTSFKGIPYAVPPVDELRWSPPVAWGNPDVSQVLDGSAFGNECKQTRANVEKGDENCLFLNVYMPENVSVADAELPVGFYIHGGSYTSGSGNDYDGTDFINFWGGQAVIVAINYRLNVFGFLGSEELRSQDPEAGTTGNYGIQDQRLAMQWVQQNIGAFGGDAGRVMIYGESAGAGSISNHLAMERSWGLFSSATLESGSFSEWVSQPLTLAQQAYVDLATAAGCGVEKEQAAQLSCLLHVKTDDLYAASLAVESADPNWGTPWNPTVDGGELRSHPWQRLAAGAVADVPVMHGSNRDEGSMFYNMPKTLDEAGLLAYWGNFHVYTAEQLAYLQDMYVRGKEYPVVEVPEGQPQPTVYWWAGMRWLGDLGFSCPTRYTSQEFSRLQLAGLRRSSAYTYHFEYHANSSSVPYVQHTAEIPFVFHMHSAINSPADLRVANVMSSYWGNFLTEWHPNDVADTLGARRSGARDGARAPVDVPLWPEYVAAADDINDIRDGSDISMVSGLKEQECHFLNNFVNADIAAKFPAV